MRVRFKNFEDDGGKKMLGAIRKEINSTQIRFYPDFKIMTSNWHREAFNKFYSLYPAMKKASSGFEIEMKFAVKMGFFKETYITSNDFKKDNQLFLWNYALTY